jgi:hypothetical protein
MMFPELEATTFLIPLHTMTPTTARQNRPEPGRAANAFVTFRFAERSLTCDQAMKSALDTYTFTQAVLAAYGKEVGHGTSRWRTISPWKSLVSGLPHWRQRHIVKLDKNISRSVAGELASVKRAAILKAEAGVGTKKKKDVLFEAAQEEFLKWGETNKKPRTVRSYRHISRNSPSRFPVSGSAKFTILTLSATNAPERRP